MQRRRLLQLGAGAALLFGAAGTLAVLWRPGLQGTKLTLEGRGAIQALSLALLDGVWPTEPDTRQRALAQQAERFEAVVSAFPPAVREELALLLALTASAPGRLGLLGSATALPARDVAALQADLNALRFSKLAMRQQAYFALRDLVNAAYFSEPAHWALMGYPGPMKL